jgi:hypothetical protein
VAPGSARYDPFATNEIICTDQKVMARRRSTKSGETWQELVELRCQREIIDRWLASCSLPDALQQYLCGMLRNIDDRLDALTKELGMG